MDSNTRNASCLITSSFSIVGSTPDMLDISAFEAVTHAKKLPGLTASAPDCCAEPPVACDVFPGSNSSKNAFCRNAILHADSAHKPC